jgi:putative lipase involved disintegration of autophagic bodies
LTFDLLSQSFPFGWEDAADGFRGHVFRSSDNATTILSIKGTTLNGPTSKKDKYNDNLLFSCCCARVDVRWALHTVCGCYAGHNKCDATCLSDAMIEDSLFYSTGVVSRMRAYAKSLCAHVLGRAWSRNYFSCTPMTTSGWSGTH